MSRRGETGCHHLRFLVAGTEITIRTEAKIVVTGGVGALEIIVTGVAGVLVVVHPLLAEEMTMNRNVVHPVLALLPLPRHATAAHTHARLVHPHILVADTIHVPHLRGIVVPAPSSRLLDVIVV